MVNSITSCTSQSFDFEENEILHIVIIDVTLKICDIVGRFCEGLRQEGIYGKTSNKGLRRHFSLWRSI